MNNPAHLAACQRKWDDMCPEDDDEEKEIDDDPYIDEPPEDNTMYQIAGP